MGGAALRTALEPLATRDGPCDVRTRERRLYIVFGLALTLFGAIWGLWHFLVSAQSGVVATTGTVMIAVLPLIVGVQLLLQAVTLDIQSAPTTPLHATVTLVKGEHPLDR